MCGGGSTNEQMWIQAPSPDMTMCSPVLSRIHGLEVLGTEVCSDVVSGGTGTLSPIDAQLSPTGLLL